MGLAVMSELPLVIIDVQRGGPSTGMPTKTEQTDLLQALYGRSGECPLVVLAATSPTDCFHMAEEVAQAGESMGFPGWKAFGDAGNRFGLLNDYIDGAMEGMRQFNYIYRRAGQKIPVL